VLRSRSHGGEGATGAPDPRDPPGHADPKSTVAPRDDDGSGRRRTLAFFQFFPSSPFANAEKPNTETPTTRSPTVTHD